MKLATFIVGGVFSCITLTFFSALESSQAMISVDRPQLSLTSALTGLLASDQIDENTCAIPQAIATREVSN